MNSLTKRAAVRLAGAALLLSGLAFNPLALAHFFLAHPLGTEGIIVLQIVLLFGGGWLVWRCPRLPLIPTVFVVLAFGTFAVLGGYGTVRSLQKVQERNRLLATIDRSEAVQQHLSGEALPLLALGMYQGQLPVAPARALFAAAIDVADVEQTVEATEVVPALGIKRQRWGIAPAEQFRGSDIQLWNPLLAAVHFFDYAAFHIETGHLLDEEETIYQARLRFDALAQTQDGERAQILARLVLDWQQEEDATWRIRRWETESLEMLTREHALFAEVLDEALPRDEDRARARFSLHAELVRQSFSDSVFVAPHRYFTRQAFDRHPGISVVDIDADGYDDLYIAVRQGRNMLLHNSGDGTFTERAAQYGLDVEHHTAAALFADFDNDGAPDVFLGRTLAPSLYMVNEDGHFASHELGDGVLPFLVASISAADYNGDGLLDAYFSTYAARMLLEAVSSASHAGALLADFLPADHARALYSLSRDRIGHLIHDAPGPPNALLRNLGDGRFAATAAVWRNTLQATWADYDRDGDPDLYLANDFAANNLLRNDGGTLVDITVESGAADPGFGMGASWADYDGDGRQDLYVTNMHSSAGRRITEAAGRAGATFAPLARGNSLLRNGREGFTLVADSPVEDGGWGWGGQFLDFDNDGDLDIYALSGYYTPPAAVALPEDT
ncbi:MAG: VCBS repeat-containing protein [Candidatus Latescibacteria bacterium]|nr:VCBS repeat-containing protein [Candidatus Latescibacterota bacterium]